MPGARCTRGLVCKVVQRNAHEHTGSAKAIRHSLRNGFTAYAVLSSATNSSCHRHRRISGFARPGRARENLRRLDTSNGRQDHTVLPYATRPRQVLRRIVHPRRSFAKPETAPFVLRACCSLTAIPPCEQTCRADAAASTASRPAFVTTAKRSLQKNRRKAMTFKSTIETLSEALSEAELDGVVGGRIKEEKPERPPRY